MDRARECLRLRLQQITERVEIARKERNEYDSSYETAMKDNLAAIEEYNSALGKLDLPDPKPGPGPLIDDMKSISFRCSLCRVPFLDEETREAARELVKVVTASLPTPPCDGKTANRMAAETSKGPLQIKIEEELSGCGSALGSRIRSQIDREMQEADNPVPAPASTLDMLHADLEHSKQRFQAHMDNARSHEAKSEADRRLQLDSESLASKERLNMYRCTKAIEALTLEAKI